LLAIVHKYELEPASLAQIVFYLSDLENTRETTLEIW